MVLKALNEFGNSRASYIAESIVYAVDNGARIVNISVGGANFSAVERAAVEYANEKDVLIIAAAGNEGRTLDDYGPGGLSGVVTVAATDQEDVRTIFSNWGQQVDLAAPGIDVLSLRARRTDTMRDIPDVEYLAGGAYVGEDNRYYRASGTSFAAPIVSGIASLVLSKDPDLSRDQLHRILTQSATDTEIPGKDQYTGYGIINAAAALSIDRDHFIDALISGVSVVEENGEVQLVLSGTANADDFRRARIEIGAGESPDSWKRVGDEIEEPVVDGQLGTIPAEEFAGSTQWVLRLVTEHDDRTEREAWFLLTLG
jgi:subtilisin family serine protease